MIKLLKILEIKHVPKVTQEMFLKLIDQVSDFFNHSLPEHLEEKFEEEENKIFARYKFPTSGMSVKNATQKIDQEGNLEKLYHELTNLYNKYK